MALITCPDCSKQVSDNAPNCIHCGCPIEKKAESSDTQLAVQSTIDEPQNESTVDPEWKLFKLSVTALGIVFLGVLVAGIATSSTKSTAKEIQIPDTQLRPNQSDSSSSSTPSLERISETKLCSTAIKWFEDRERNDYTSIQIEAREREVEKIILNKQVRIKIRLTNLKEWYGRLHLSGQVCETQYDVWTNLGTIQHSTYANLEAKFDELSDADLEFLVKQKPESRFDIVGTVSSAVWHEFKLKLRISNARLTNTQ